MRFKESYIRKIIQEELMQLENQDFSQQNQEPPEHEEDSEIITVEINKEEMQKILGNIESIRNGLKSAVSATETEGLHSLDDLDRLHKWFEDKISGKEAEPWNRDITPEEHKFLDKHFHDDKRSKNDE